jgi:hypothetical protein
LTSGLVAIATPWPSTAAWITWSYCVRCSAPRGVSGGNCITSRQAFHDSHGAPPSGRS